MAELSARTRGAMVALALAKKNEHVSDAAMEHLRILIEKAEHYENSDQRLFFIDKKDTVHLLQCERCARREANTKANRFLQNLHDLYARMDEVELKYTNPPDGDLQ